MEVRPLTGSEFVAEVVGLDASKTLDAEQVIACRRALADHRVLVFRDQILEPDAYVAFAKNFGSPVPHVLDHLRMDGTPECIDGMSEGETDQLLSQLREHAISERFIYRHPYRVGDVAIWDTTATLHSATTIPKADGPDNSRLLWRISVVDG